MNKPVNPCNVRNRHVHNVISYFIVSDLLIMLAVMLNMVFFTKYLDNVHIFL